MILPYRFSIRECASSCGKAVIFQFIHTEPHTTPAHAETSLVRFPDSSPEGTSRSPRATRRRTVRLSDSRSAAEYQINETPTFMASHLRKAAQAPGRTPALASITYTGHPAVGHATLPSTTLVSTLSRGKPPAVAVSGRIHAEVLRRTLSSDVARDGEGMSPGTQLL